MAFALAVVAVVVAVAALGVAWRAWPREGGGEALRYPRSGPPRGRGLTRAVEVLVVVDLLAGAGLAVSFLGGRGRASHLSSESHLGARSSADQPSTGRPTPAPPTRTGRHTSTMAPPTTAPSTKAPPTSAPATSVPSVRSSSTSTSTPRSTSTTSKSPRSATSARTHSGAKPVLASISPASGVAGARVTLTGSGFFSKDGQITVTFGVAYAPVACPSETTCQATVPSRAKESSASVGVTISTEAGSSNTLSFRYAG